MQPPFDQAPDFTCGDSRSTFDVISGSPSKLSNRRSLRSGLQNAATQSGQDFDAVRRRRMQAIPAQRFGTPEEFGQACAFLCSAQAGFISGQNLGLDGGSYAGLL